MIRKSSLFFIVAFVLWLVMSTVFSPGVVYYLLFFLGFLSFCVGGWYFLGEKIKQIKHFFGK
ncbi:hypothetical protein [Weissella confusa]|uniref:hypothetical protein n=1 Tax=Weissella confusa TaxID=1583 RepID=UPI001081D713|nr:hypothetical protein [Weissella confusa]MCT0014201.1 hypothetical protein [Weissella confusa]TGE71046.1 hypothetical protein C6P15_01920 [Weissella confusa]